MIGVRAFVRVDMAHIDHLPFRMSRLEEYIIQTMAEERAAPGPADHVGGRVPMQMDLAEGIQPGRADMFHLAGMLRGIKITGDNGRPARGDFLNPGI